MGFFGIGKLLVNNITQHRLAKRLLYALSHFTHLCWLEIRWLKKKRGRPHGLKGELIISLTSYQKRFVTLHRTLKCLLSQTISADRIILWVSNQDYKVLPESVTSLRYFGLDIRSCRDIGPYKKIIPTLQTFPDAYIATADDDVYYSENWLEELIENANERTVVCHRGHSMIFDDSGEIISYRKWPLNVSNTISTLFPTGVGGVLYGPKSLAPEVLKEDIFMNICPRSDDVWLFWMGRLARSRYIKTHKKWYELPWRGSQKSALSLQNFHSDGNDKPIKEMVRYYGLPDFTQNMGK